MNQNTIKSLFSDTQCETPLKELLKIHFTIGGFRVKNLNIYRKKFRTYITGQIYICDPVDSTMKWKVTFWDVSGWKFDKNGTCLKKYTLPTQSVLKTLKNSLDGKGVFSHQLNIF